MKSPKKPKPTEADKALQKRQILDLAKLDEEENRRIKALFRPQYGAKAFRIAGTARGDQSGKGPLGSSPSGSSPGTVPSFGGFRGKSPF